MGGVLGIPRLAWCLASLQMLQHVLGGRQLMASTFIGQGLDGINIYWPGLGNWCIQCTGGVKGKKGDKSHLMF
eukprot:4893400-Amphidinium_carterae.1